MVLSDGQCRDEQPPLMVKRGKPQTQETLAIAYRFQMRFKLFRWRVDDSAREFNGQAINFLFAFDRSNET